MKKLLLSALAVAACASVSATEYTLNMQDASDFQGTYSEEKKNDDGSVKEGAKYQPLASLTVDGFTFATDKATGKSDPAYYFPTTTATTKVYTIRVYTGNTLTITAPEGVKMGKIVFTGSNGTAGAATTANVGGISDVTKTAMTWVNTEAVSSVTITYAANFRIASMVVSTEGGDIPTPPAQATFAKTTTVDNGKYVFAVNEDGTVKMAGPENAGATYGRMLLGATISGNTVTTSEANAFDLTVADGKVTIKDAEGRFYGMDNSHFTSFQFYTEANEGCYWTYAVEGENVKFTNVLNNTCIISQTKGTSGTWYTNLAPAKAPTEFNLPMLFKQDGAGVETIVVENENAPVEYFNLQGVRVAEPANGIFIRRQGNKVTKVAL